jgi:ABC-2 type transport system permease protein
MTARYLSLLRALAASDFKLKYQGSVLGYGWSLMKPLVMFAVLYVVFTKFIRLGGSVPYYPVYLLLGIVLWNYFTEATVLGLTSVVDRGHLIRKVYFPRLIVVVAAGITALITLLLNLAVVAVFIVFSGAPVRPTLVLFPLLLVELTLLSLGCSLLLSALYVRFRDFRHVWDLALQILFYATPIIYPLTLVPAAWRPLVAISPITQVIEDVRFALITPSTLRSSEVLGWPLAMVPYLIPFLLFVVGYRYFVRAAASFAEEL